MIRKLLGRLFPSRRTRATESLQRIADDQRQAGPPAPRRKYVLRLEQTGAYEITDGGHTVGFLLKHQGDKDRRTRWDLSLGKIALDFASLKEAKEWLSKPRG